MDLPPTGLAFVIIAITIACALLLREWVDGWRE